MVTLKLFGGVSIETATGPVTGRAAHRHPLALLALLAASPDRSLSRDKLIAYLWPERDAGKGRHALSDAAYRLNCALNGKLIHPIGDALRLDTRSMVCDLLDFRAALHGGEFSEVVGLYSGPFLDGFFLTQAESFESWQALTRDALAQDYARALQSLAEDSAASGDHVAAAQWWRKLFAHDPSNARLTLRAMAALEDSGERCAALQLAETHMRVLRDELDVEPDPEIPELAEQLRREPSAGKAFIPAKLDSSAAAPTAPPAADLSDEPQPSIAVLPFENFSSNDSDDYFALGLTEDVLTRLAQLKALRVIARASVMRYQNTDKDISTIANELGVAYVLEGSVRRSGDRVRISAQLIEARTNSHLWAETYDRTLKNIFAIQSDIATEVADQLHVTLSGPTVARLERVPTRSMVAYELYLRARALRAKETVQGSRQSIDLLKRALERDPGFAMAHVLLSHEYGRQALNYGGGERYVALLRRHAECAVELVSDSAEALGALGFAHELIGQYVQAANLCERALELKPHDCYALNTLGIVYFLTGRGPKAICLFQAAATGNPARAFLYRANATEVFQHLGLLDRAEEVASQVLAVAPDFIFGLHNRGVLALLRGDRDLAVATAEHLRSLAGNDARGLLSAGMIFLYAGYPDRALPLLKRTYQISRTASTRLCAVPALLGYALGQQGER